MNEPKCIVCGRPIPEGRFICLHCEGQNEMQKFSKKPKTNGGRIRQMTDEELATFIDIYSIEDICRTRCAVVNYQDCMQSERCKLHILEWLKQEAD